MKAVLIVLLLFISLNAKEKGFYESTGLDVVIKTSDYMSLVQITLAFLIILLIIAFFFFREKRLKSKIEKLTQSLEQRVEDEVKKNKNKDQQMFYQSRLAQMGEMISMIAHQWRQPLGAISATSIDMTMQIELEKFDLEKQDERENFYNYFKERLSNIESFTQGLTKTIDDFRDFYKQTRISTTTSLDVPIQKALNIVQESIKTNNIRLVEKYNSQKELSLFEGELMQVILNILKNAEDNFEIAKIEDALIIIETKDTDEGVVMSICDNGGGIPTDIIEKIFDPYFSTKHAKNGTGLGLYMSKMIIEEHHNGSISVLNRDNGACFYIEIKESR